MHAYLMMRERYSSRVAALPDGSGSALYRASTPASKGTSSAAPPATAGTGLSTICQSAQDHDRLSDPQQPKPWKSAIEASKLCGRPHAYRVRSVCTDTKKSSPLLRTTKWATMATTCLRTNLIMSGCHNAITS